jgi:FixJ family two-component response regulator
VIAGATASAARAERFPTRLRAENGWVPVVLISAFADGTMSAEAGRLGATRVFAKPFALGDLLALVREVAPRGT